MFILTYTFSTNTNTQILCKWMALNKIICIQFVSSLFVICRYLKMICLNSLTLALHSQSTMWPIWQRFNILGHGPSVCMFLLTGQIYNLCEQAKKWLIVARRELANAHCEYLNNGIDAQRNMEYAWNANDGSKIRWWLDALGEYSS